MITVNSIILCVCVCVYVLVCMSGYSSRLGQPSARPCEKSVDRPCESAFLCKRVKI